MAFDGPCFLCQFFFSSLFSACGSFMGVEVHETEERQITMHGQVLLLTLWAGIHLFLFSSFPFFLFWCRGLDPKHICCVHSSYKRPHFALALFEICGAQMGEGLAFERWLLAFVLSFSCLRPMVCLLTQGLGPILTGFTLDCVILLPFSFLWLLT